MVSGSQSVMELEPACAMILKGPKNFSVSLIEGQVVLNNLALTKACCPILKSGVGMCQRSAGPWYQS